MNSLAPVQIKDREVFMDVLRGIAILGIFIANLQFMSYYSASFNGSYTYPSLDKKMAFLHAMFIEGKFYSIFSLLFGWGIALQMSRSKLSETAVAKFIRRRLWFMILLGGIHLFFIWIGDIVLFYGLIGFILVALRKKSNKQLLILGSVLLFLPIVLYFLKMKFQWLNAPAGIFFEASSYLQTHWAGLSKEVNETTIIRSSNSLWTDVKLNMAASPFRFAYLIFVSRIPKVLGMMLIGFVIGRSGIYKRIGEYKKQLWWFVIIGLAISIPANYMLAFYMENPNNYYNLKIEGWYETIAYAFGVAPLAIVYVVLLALFFQLKNVEKILQVLAPVGKMAFTNYMSHSIIGIIVFHNIGLGYMQQLGTFALTIFAVIVFIGQIIFSTIWLRYFEFGPIEWAWRSLTYGKMQKMIKLKV